MKILILILSNIFESLSYNSLIKTGRFLGIVAYYLLPGRRRIAVKNAEIIGAFNPKKVAKESFKNSFSAFLEIFHTKKIDKNFLEKNVEFSAETEQKLSDFNKNYGSYFVAGAHLGSWELVAKIFSLKYGKQTCIVGRRIKNKNVDDLIRKFRADENIIYLSHRNIAFEIAKIANQDTVIGTLLDHSALGKDAIYVDFFGHKTSFIAGIPILSVKKNIPIIPLFCVREKNGKLKFVSYDPILPDNTLKPKERILDVARKINMVYEDIIKKYPEQWYLIHKRFKRVKKDESDEKTYSLY
ncbi:lysophospholipid acyltransferase family protein [Deferribacterales bacterium Es71-Z0220]|uniref:lysophospholipid acyltransferase family protein n=1 Tax=Deferrivibrio essentukiensis TaxID=2880922 RepID=UPI001F613385|nr:lysophospholipid acyltransferase family protein [Deferrivibrio essentukiensis]MCB4205209.1 lysophospholipid acyltransferase family protein [Deferrivibrio essentukiensis]